MSFKIKLLSYFDLIYRILILEINTNLFMVSISFSEVH